MPNRGNFFSPNYLVNKEKSSPRTPSYTLYFFNRVYKLPKKKILKISIHAITTELVYNTLNEILINRKLPFKL